MEEVISNYIADKVLEDLRNNGELKDDLADVLNSYQWLVFWRQRISVEDKEWLKETVLAKKSHTSELCITLMHPLREENDIKELLFSLWNSPSSDYFTKMQVMWRLLDYADLSDKTINEIYQYVFADWNTWLPYMVKKFGGADRAYENCIERLNNPGFPESKKWVYLCILVGSSKIDEAKTVISRYKDSKTSINVLVAKDLIEMIG